MQSAKTVSLQSAKSVTRAGVLSVSSGGGSGVVQVIESADRVPGEVWRGILDFTLKRMAWENLHEFIRRIAELLGL